MSAIMVITPGTIMDQSDPEGRYWESDVESVPIHTLYDWIGDYIKLDSIFTTWDHFLSEKLKELSLVNSIPF